MTWFYQGNEFKPDDIGDALGFIYVIEHPNGKKYIGQKKFFFVKTLAPLKGQTRMRKIVQPSDWQTYTGSNDELNLEVKRLGIKAFKRTIIVLCITKAEMNYRELKAQMDNDVLMKPNEFFNGFVGGRINRKQLARIIPQT